MSFTKVVGEINRSKNKYISIYTTMIMVAIIDTHAYLQYNLSHEIHL